MSKAIVEGKIEVLLAKELPEADQFGNNYRLSVKMDNGTWYGFGTAKKDALNIKDGAGWHSVVAGDTIEFVAEQRGQYWNAQKKTLSLKAKGGGSNGQRSNTSAAPSSPANRIPNALARTVSTGGGDDRQDCIMRQNAMSHASLIIAHHYAGTLDNAAKEVLRLANEYFLPYAKRGTLPDDRRDLENQKQQEMQSKLDDFEDSEIPF